jgi:HlyD family secretion protein
MLGGIGLLLAVTATWTLFGRAAPVDYRTAAAEFGDLDVTVSATGAPNAVVTVQVGSQVSGNIQALFADFNTKVTHGQQIAQIDPAPFQTKVNEARAAVEAARSVVANSQAVEQQAHASIQAARSAFAAAQANVTKATTLVEDAKAKVDRRVVMVNKGADAREDLETAQTTYQSAIADRTALVAEQQAADDGVKVAEAQLTVARSQVTENQALVTQSQAALAAAEIDLNHTRITAPVDGVVVSRSVDVGQTVAASLAAPTLFLIAQDLTKMQVDTNVSEADVGRVRVGQPASFTVDAYPGRTFTGTVTSIREAPITVQNVVTYDAVIGVSNDDLTLFPGMTANVKILIMRRPGVLKVPNAALRYRPDTAARQPAATDAAKAVWVLDSAAPRRVEVTTGETDGSATEITSGGVHPGDRVIVAALSSTATPATGAAPAGRGPGF